MAPSPVSIVATILATSTFVAAHQSIWHNSVFGFNESTAPNRLQDPLMNMAFDDWWFHGFLDQPPNDGDYMELPAGGTIHSEIACDKGYTSWYETAAGGDIRSPDQPDYPCPGQPLSQFHTTGVDDLGGCALAIAYESDATQVKPEDFAVFSVNQTCVWTLHTDFQVPAAMPECPEEGCTCAWFWIHTPDSGSEQMYMTGFRCKVTGATSTTPISTPQLARRCGADSSLGRSEATPSNCTYGAKQPFYWYQAEGNTFFEDQYHPPLYTDLYNFLDGAQDDIFEGAASSSGSYSASASSSASSSYYSSSAADSSSYYQSSTADSSSYYASSTADSATYSATETETETETYPADPSSTYVAPSSTYTPESTSSAYTPPASSGPAPAPSSTDAPPSSSLDPAPTSPSSTEDEPAPTSSSPAYTPPSRPSSGVSKRWNPDAQATSPAMARYLHAHQGKRQWGSWGHRRGFRAESEEGEEEEEV